MFEQEKTGIQHAEDLCRKCYARDASSNELDVNFLRLKYICNLFDLKDNKNISNSELDKKLSECDNCIRNRNINSAEYRKKAYSFENIGIENPNLESF